MKRIQQFILFALLLLANVAHASQGGGGSGSHWGYEGAEGPGRWGSLGYPLCAEGKNQSPVDIVGTAQSLLDPIVFNYSPVPIDVVNNGHTIQFNYKPGSFITVGGERYDLVQFHFHSPSENIVNGKPYPLEVHLVHKNAKGHLAVVGVFFEEKKSEGEKHNGQGEKEKHGSGDQTMANVFGALPGVGNMHLTGNVDINADGLLPHNRTYVHFMGSLTTPPCSEGVSWFVVMEPVAISVRELVRFQTIFNNNARPVQSWGRRNALTPAVDSSKGNGSGH